jgi:hypothetical protein
MGLFRIARGSFLLGCAVGLAGLVMPAHRAAAVISYSYSQDFNSLPTDPTNNASLQPTPYTNGWQDDSTTVAGNHIGVPGWYLYHPLGSGSELGTNAHQRFREGNGQNTGSFWGFSTNNPTDSDKALGSIGSTTTAADNTNMYMGVRLTNTTADTLGEFTLTYDGEEYRDGQLATPETLSFAYSTSATTADWNTTATFTSVPALNFTSPVFAGTGSSGTLVDGNTAGKVAGITATVSGISWAPGTDIWLRWADPQAPSAADDGLAIDNVNFVASIPEPASLALLGIAATSLLTARRRRACR